MRRIIVLQILVASFVGSSVWAQKPVNFKNSNLPIILIDTHGSPIYDDFEVDIDLGVVFNSTGVRNDTADAFNNYQGKATIEIRGSSSQMFPKKQYKIELKDDAGEDRAVSLLGMPAEADWVLFAPYNDKSLMRDVLSYKLGRDMGRYAPRTRYCEVVMKVEDADNTPHYVYQGVYVLIEKIKRDKNRVDIAKLNPDENTGDDVTGGYILKIDKGTGNDGSTGASGWASKHAPDNNVEDQFVFFQYEYPKWDEISSDQKKYIKEYVGKFEDALGGNHFTDPVNGYAKYVDVNSFIDFMIIQEITRNVDGYRISTFFHKQKESDGGKLVMGPIWDFNLGFGNADYCSGSDRGRWMYEDFNIVCGPYDGTLVPFWWRRFMQDPVFKLKLAERWNTLRQDKFSTAAIHGDIDSIYTLLNAESSARNFQAWPVLGQYVWPNEFVGSSFAEEIDYLKEWIENRMDWLDDNMPKITANEPVVYSFDFDFGTNPVRENEIVFEYDIKKPGNMQIALHDATGRKIKTIEANHAGAGSFKQTLLTSEVGRGLRIVKVSFNGEQMVSKLLVE
jgi:hypothetical protein